MPKKARGSFLGVAETQARNLHRNAFSSNQSADCMAILISTVFYTTKCLIGPGRKVQFCSVRKVGQFYRYSTQHHFDRARAEIRTSPPFRRGFAPKTAAPTILDLRFDRQHLNSWFLTTFTLTSVFWFRPSTSETLQLFEKSKVSV